MDESITPSTGFTRRVFAYALAAGLALTILNAIKPVHMDDVVYVYYAEQARKHPLAPYDFEIPWNQVPDSAQNPISPPVVPYWLSAGMVLFGSNPILWKLWFLPFNLFLTCSVSWIFRRFARGFEVPLLWMTTLSPVVLASSNLMLDVPCLALGLTSMALFLSACDRRSTRLAVLAGLACGLAMETKWTAFLTLATIMSISVFYFRPKQGSISVAIAVLMFASWEGYIKLQNGESHFFHQLKINNPGSIERSLSFPLVMILGAIGPALTLIGLASLRISRQTVFLAGGLFSAGFALMILLNSPLQSLGLIHVPIIGKAWIPKLGSPLFVASGLTLVVTLAMVCWRLWASRLLHFFKKSRRDDLFLISWFCIELAGYFVFSPFPAVRRVIGLVFVVTVIFGRLASRTCRTPPRATLVRFATYFGMALGSIFYITDLGDAMAVKRGAELAARWIRERDPNGKIYFSGWGGFEFYAPRLGLEPMLSDRTEMKAGEWLMIEMTAQDELLCYRLDDKDVNLQEIISVGDPFPLTTLRYFYIGGRPIECLVGPRMKVMIYRLSHDIRPARTYENGRVVFKTPVPLHPNSWEETRPSLNP